MRLSLSKKVLLVFSSLTAITILLGLTAYIGNYHNLRHIEFLSLVKDFQMEMERLKVSQASMPDADAIIAKAKFNNGISVMLALSKRIIANVDGLSDRLRLNLDKLPGYLESYRQAGLELIAKYQRDQTLPRENSAIREAIVKLIHEMPPPERERHLYLLNEMLPLQLHIIHDRDLAGLNRFKEMVRTERKAGQHPRMTALLGDFVLNLESNYLNFLAIRDRKRFMEKTADHFFDVTRQTLNEINLENRRYQSFLIWSIGLISALAILINLFLWWRTQSYFKRFIVTQHRIIKAVQNSDYTMDLPKPSDDEIGDLTETLKDLAHSLDQSEKKYRSMMESMKDPIYISSSNLRLEFINKAMQEMLGRDATGERCHDALHGFKERCQWCMHSRVQAMETCETEIFSPKLKRHFNASSSPLVRKDGSISKLTAFRDTTGIKKMEARLRQAQKMEAVGTLAGGIAHDFNNFLAAISGYTELALEKTQSGQTDPKDLSRVLKAADRAKDMVRRILAFSRQTELDFKPLDLNDEVGQVVRMLERTIPRMISVECRLARDIYAINGDASQLDQVLLNLGTNARDAMPQGGNLVFETCNLDIEDIHPDQPTSLTPGKYVMLIVSDTGHGMDKSVLEKAFDPFFTTKEVGSGTGMGLAMVYGIIKSHNGHIDCYSEPGRGTTFKIYLPALRDQSLTGGTRLEAGPDPIGEGQTILVVDDEEPLRTLACRLLERNGYRTEWAANGAEALALLGEKADEIDLVLLDLNMPVMGGQECLRQVMEMDPDAKIIIVSGHHQNNLSSELKGMGALGLLLKPYRKSDLLHSIHRAILE